MNNWVRTYEHGADYIESRDGTSWGDAPIPGPWHRCRTQTRGWLSLNYTERCACGAIRLSPREPWMEKNQTRKQRKQKRRDERAPKQIMTCQECGNAYEAVKGSLIAQQRMCTDCWSREFLRFAQGDR